MQDWIEEQNKLQKDFEFENFKDALNFVNKIGELAEREMHHPDIFMHDYKFVKIFTSTHDVGMVTQKDFDLSKLIDSIFSNR